MSCMTGTDTARSAEDKTLLTEVGPAGSPGKDAGPPDGEGGSGSRRPSYISENPDQPTYAGISPDTDMEGHGLLSEAAKDIEESMNRLSSSKDRAQMTANTALSLSMIVVLKEIIDLGPQSNKYYLVNLILVSLSLLFQVVIGFLALVMYSLKAKDEHSSTLRKRAQNALEIDIELQNVRRNSIFAGPPADKVSLRWYKDLYQRLLVQERARIIPGCCNCDDYTDSERAMLEMHEYINEELMPSFLETGSGEHTTFYGTITAEEAGKAGKDKPQRLLLVEAKVAARVRLIKRKKLIENITAVQNAITYLMYIVFILNAFITGFGLS